MAGKKALKLQLNITLENNTINYSKLFNGPKRHERSDMKIKSTKGRLVIEVTAKDATALRASANSILRDLQVIEATELK